MYQLQIVIHKRQRAALSAIINQFSRTRGRNISIDSEGRNSFDVLSVVQIRRIKSDEEGKLILISF